MNINSIQKKPRSRLHSIKIFAPATVANVSCGFDILGFAVDAPGDEVILRLTDTPGVKILEITGDNGKLPLQAAKNTVGASIISMLKFLGSNQGVEIILHKKMPLGSGLGSSAASSAAGAVGLNHLLNTQLTKQQLVTFAMEGERVACGTAHADNVAPAIFGGFTLVRSYNPLDIIPIHTPPELYCSIIHPNIEVSTKAAREILSPSVKLADAVVQWGNVAGLIAGLMSNNYELISRSMQDVIIEPVRQQLIPGFSMIKQAALSNGALGAGISGSGPSIFALSRNIKTAEIVAQAMQHAYNQTHLNSEIYVSKINHNGVTIL
ncbi:MAG: homoserine kinase [Pseudomonadota bacterium]|nr:homoserine kinase [Pseudomonadota bacterium]